MRTHTCCSPLALIITCVRTPPRDTCFPSPSRARESRGGAGCGVLRVARRLCAYVCVYNARARGNAKHIRTRRAFIGMHLARSPQRRPRTGRRKSGSYAHCRPFPVFGCVRSYIRTVFFLSLSLSLSFSRSADSTGEEEEREERLMGAASLSRHSSRLSPESLAAIRCSSLGFDCLSTRGALRVA